MTAPIDRGVLDVEFQTERFQFRRLTEADVSQRWADWLNDPVAARMLNARPRSLSLDELRDYLRRFDGRQRWLLGIFDRRNGRHIGIATGEVVEDGRKFVPAILIGEPEYRNHGMLTEILDHQGEHFFEKLGFEATVATVLAYNEPVVAFLESRGFRRVRTLPGYKKSAQGGPDIDLFVYEFSREDWRRYRNKKKALGGTQD
jgi:RimJ/RimL family protein N-acetyltransferase